MKKIILIAILMLCSPAIAHSQDKEGADTPPVLDTHQYIIYTNPINYFDFWSYYNLGLQYKLSEKTAVGGALLVPNEMGVTGFGFNGDFRWYTFGTGIQKLFFAPRVGASYITASGSSEESANAGESSFLEFQIVGFGGWQLYIGKDFSLAVGFGVGFYFRSYFEGEDDSNAASGSRPIILLELGYAW